MPTATRGILILLPTTSLTARTSVASAEEPEATRAWDMLTISRNPGIRPVGVLIRVLMVLGTTSAAIVLGFAISGVGNSEPHTEASSLRTGHAEGEPVILKGHGGPDTRPFD